MYNVFDRFFFREISIHKCQTKYVNNFWDKEEIIKASIILECYSWLDQRKLENNFKCQEHGHFLVQISVDELIYEKGNRGYEAAVQNASSKHR